MAISRQPGAAYPQLALPEGPEDLKAFQHWLEKAIPMVQSLGLRKMSQGSGHLIWELSLTPSLNDKGTGFGGALTAQTTLIGWCWVTLWLRQRGLARDVVVVEAAQRFLAPVTRDYRLVCEPEDPAGPKALANRLDSRGKGRITLVQTLCHDDILCLEAHGTYAVLP